MRTILLWLTATMTAPVAVAQVQNPGFENGINGWNAYCPCQPYQVSGNVPPGGGQAALEVGILDFNCFCTIVETIYQPASWLTPGTWVLSAWIRNADPGNVPGAAVRLSEGPAYSSPILADAWSDAGVWTFVADTFLITGSTDINALQLSLIPDDGNQMPAGLFAAFDQVQIQQLLSTSIADLSNAIIPLLPNPAQDELSITLEGNVTDIMLVDITGRSTSATVSSRNGNTTTIDLTGLSHGPWLLKATTANGIRTARFIKY